MSMFYSCDVWPCMYFHISDGRDAKYNTSEDKGTTWQDLEYEDEDNDNDDTQRYVYVSVE